MPGPRLLVDAPPFTPSPYGLLSVVDWRTDGSPHWQNGVTWVERCLGENMGNTTFDECIAVTGGPPGEKLENVDSTSRGATPFTPYVRFKCAPVGLADAERTARDALAQSEQFQVEYSFWTGLADSNDGTGGTEVVYPHLASTTSVLDAQGVVMNEAATIVDASAQDPAIGLGRLEETLAQCYNGVGVIHMPVKALPTFVGNGLVRFDGGRDSVNGQVGRRLRTANGNLVAVGSGYPGSSPAGVAAGEDEAWLFATGAVFGYRGEVQYTRERESINRSINEMDMIAERTYVLGWSCCHAAVLVTLGVPVS